MLDPAEPHAETLNKLLCALGNYKNSHVEAQIIQQVMEMSRREQEEFERTIALSLADKGRGGVGAGAVVAANDEEAQIIQQVMEMSRREQDVRACDGPLPSRHRTRWCWAGTGMAATASREADSESDITTTARALGLSKRDLGEQQLAFQCTLMLLKVATCVCLSTHHSTYRFCFCKNNKRTIIIKDKGGNDNIKKLPGGYFYQRQSENDPWVCISETEYKERRKEGGHLVDLGIAAKLLKKIPGPGLGEK